MGQVFLRPGEAATVVVTMEEDDEGPGIATPSDEDLQSLAVDVGSYLIGHLGAGSSVLSTITLGYAKDDLLGSAVWAMTTDDVLDRGTLAHQAPFDAIDGSLVDASFLVDARTAVSVHPVIDGTLRDATALGPRCTADTDCANPGWTCRFDACVPPGWTDTTASSLGAGYVERISFEGEDRFLVNGQPITVPLGLYDLYVTWRVVP